MLQTKIKRKKEIIKIEKCFAVTIDFVSKLIEEESVSKLGDEREPSCM